MNLASYLEAKNLSPAEFGAKVGVGGEAIRCYIRGDRRPRDKVMRAIIAETDGAVTANDFYAAEPAPQ